MNPSPPPLRDVRDVGRPLREERPQQSRGPRLRAAVGKYLAHLVQRAIPEDEMQERQIGESRVSLVLDGGPPLLDSRDTAILKHDAHAVAIEADLQLA